ncbi:membrane protein insertase YidC [Advenella kashmirensis]|nr:membrane protein insertase YidC [Advenella kashmirensis]
MDIRRTILWMIFVFSAFMLWNNWQTYTGHPSLLGEQPKVAQQDNTAPASATPQADTPSAPAVPGASTTPAQAQAATSAPSEIVDVETDEFRLQFDTMGAQLVHAELRKHRDTADETKSAVLLENNETSRYTVQSGIVAPAGQKKNYPDQYKPFKLVSTETTMTGDTLPVVFESESGGLKVTRTYTFNKGTYRVDVKDVITNTSQEPQQPSQYLQITRDSKDPPGASSFYHTFTGPAIYTEEGRFQKFSFSDIDKNSAEYIKQAKDGWIAMIEHYFVTAWVPPEGKDRLYNLRKTPEGLYAVSTVEPLGTLAPGASITTNAELWVGPQDQDALASVAPGLDVVVDYGWLTIIAKPMFAVMQWIHSIVGNWGWTIVLLTVLIKLIFFPLSAASYKSMAKMKNVAPRMQAMKEKYGDDRQALNAAMMEMYRNEKINPLGGCLPILVQIPVFLTLYRVLLASVEMRGAPWIGWIHDLSVHDPYFILPIFMMASMFLQMRLNPKPPDPMQAKIMMFMPLIFGAMMFMFPAGLVLYWCVNNVLSIAQQWFITHNMNKAANDAKIG